MQNKDEVVKMGNVLALDIATHCGYATFGEGGTWDFSESKKRNDNKQHGSFRATLIKFIQEHDIKRIVAEDCNVNKHFFDERKLAEFRGILLEICDTLNIPEPAFINTGTLKKWATGDGKADKAKMIEYCIKRWHIEPIDDNEADATHIYFWYIKKFHITQ
jgi:Holliday junction resolvasome RuvABC endonuclease subunit